MLWNSSKPRGDEDKHNINASRVFRLCPLRRKRHNTRSALAIPQSQTFKDVHLVPCSGFSVKVFFFKRRERERKRKSHCQSRIQQTEQSQHSCLEKNVGLKAWSCLTCIISPSTHPSITVLSVWGCAAYDLPRLKKKKRFWSYEEEKPEKPWVAQTDLKLDVINGAMTASVLIFWSVIFFIFSSTWDVSVSAGERWLMNAELSDFINLAQQLLTFFFTDRYKEKKRQEKGQYCKKRKKKKKKSYSHGKAAWDLKGILLSAWCQPISSAYPAVGTERESLAAFRLSSLDVVQPSSTWDNMEASPESPLCHTKGPAFWSEAVGIYHEKQNIQAIIFKEIRQGPAGSIFETLSFCFVLSSLVLLSEKSHDECNWFYAPVRKTNFCFISCSLLIYIVNDNIVCYFFWLPSHSM